MRKPTGIRFTDDEYKAIASYAAKHDTSFSDVVRCAARKFLDPDKNKGYLTLTQVASSANDNIALAFGQFLDDFAHAKNKAAQMNRRGQKKRQGVGTTTWLPLRISSRTTINYPSQAGASRSAIALLSRCGPSTPKILNFKHISERQRRASFAGTTCFLALISCKGRDFFANERTNRAVSYRDERRTCSKKLNLSQFQQIAKVDFWIARKVFGNSLSRNVFNRKA